MPNIVVVESKDKIQSVSKYLGDGYLGCVPIWIMRLKID